MYRNFIDRKIYKNIIIGAEYDYDAPNPFEEWDAMPSIIFSSDFDKENYTNGSILQNVSNICNVSELKELAMREYETDFVFALYCDSDLSSFSLYPSGYRGFCGVICMSKESLSQGWSKGAVDSFDADKLKDIIENSLSSFNRWASGRVYCVVVESEGGEVLASLSDMHYDSGDEAIAAFIEGTNVDAIVKEQEV